MKVEERALPSIVRQKADIRPPIRCASIRTVKTAPVSRARFWVDVIIATAIVAVVTWALFAR